MRWLLLLAAELAACGTEIDPPDRPADIEPDGRPLRELAEARDLKIGTFLWSAAGPDGPDQPAFQAALHEHDMYILPVFMRLAEPARGTFDFSLPDAVADAAPEGTVFYIPGFGNDLLPDWLDPEASPAELQAIIVEYVSTTVAHFRDKYPGRVAAYEVVFEALSYPGPPNATGAWQRIGDDKDDWVRIAFHAARDAAPDGTLYIDDFGVEGDDDKADRYVAQVRGLLDEGVPIDGVAFEGHFMLGGDGAFPAPPPTAIITRNLERFWAMGLQTMISSVDIALRDDRVSPQTLDDQAAAYRGVIDACLGARGCTGFGTWGLGDPDSWIVQYFDGWGSPLLFDAHYARKPAYDAVWNALLRE